MLFRSMNLNLNESLDLDFDALAVLMFNIDESN